ncbi:MAG: maltooligosyltrehalose trehalohydrolase [Actinomycetota bacterium]|jgi:maltooligosyltrehalose trehalohydrolase
MTAFRVWAPRAERVELVVDEDRRVPMHATADGWHEAETETETETYAFSLDGGPPRPDPRSPWQPDGVDGPSRVVDHARFPWTDQAWRGVHLPSAVMYELHVGTFSPEGTFDGVIGRLDHLVALGVDVVELMPVAEFPGDRGWGYDGVDLYAPHHAYGGPDGLKRLVDACHARGVGVVLDVVYNHVGPSGNYLRDFGPYFTDRYATPWGEAVNLDGPDSDEVRRFFVDNALMWFRDYHLDGLRLDAVHAIVDTSAVHLLEQLAIEVADLAASVGRPLHLIAESDLNDPRLVWRREAGGYGLDAQWSDDLHHALHAVLTGEHSGYYADFGQLDEVATALRRAFVYAGEHSHFRRRRHGRRPGAVPGWRFLGYIQNHDQVGNRATGERIGHVASLDRVRAGAALVMTSPFVPMVFQGEEWAASTPFQYFTDHHDPELAEAVREGRRREFSSFGWRPEDVPDPQAPETYERSKLDWAELAQPQHAEMLEWYRSLIALRRGRAELRDGRMDLVRVDVDHERARLTLCRGATTVVVDLGTEPASVVITPPPG